MTSTIVPLMMRPKHSLQKNEGRVPAPQVLQKTYHSFATHPLCNVKCPYTQQPQKIPEQSACHTNQATNQPTNKRTNQPTHQPPAEPSPLSLLAAPPGAEQNGPVSSEVSGRKRPAFDEVHRTHQGTHQLSLWVLFGCWFGGSHP